VNAKTGALTTLGGLALGAGLMYVLDPDRGAHRRVKLQKKIRYAGKRAASLAMEARRVALNPARLFA
jgi:hypothetical protein